MFEWILKKNERRTDKMKTKLTETSIVTPTSIHINKTTSKQGKRAYISLEAIVFRYYNTRPGCRLASSNLTGNGCYLASYRR